MDKNLIGIESRIDKLLSLLKTEVTQEVRIVGIHGMGGIGKTTLAQALFRRISHDFEGSSFVKNVRENSSSKRDICALQEKILKDILGRHHNCKIEDPEDGAAMIETRFCKKKVLLVIDDVDHANQLEFLAGTHEWFGAGSRIVITTRDEHLLLDTNANYKAEFLLYEQAIELFSRHAFRKISPPDGYEELSNRAISYTGRLPLALKVLGSFLRGRLADEWRSALDRLAIEPDGEILRTLKISFNGLKKSEQQIFLDIACLFKGKEQERVTRILDSFGFHPTIGVRALIDKSLISVSMGKLVMHDLLQEMALDIIRESYPGSRLWQRKNIKDYIENKRELKAIEAIVDPAEWTVGINADDFKNMVKLRLLDICGKFTSCEPPFLPDELRWIRWLHYPFSSLGVPNKLVGLEIRDGKFSNLRMGPKVMLYFKFIKLKGLDYLKRFPDVSGAPNLESLELLSCWNLVEVHGSLGSHKKLVHLRMSGCSKLKSLPHRFEMESLETLDLSDCGSLEIFPEVSSCMVNLSAIDLYNCINLKCIPNSICELKSLKALNLQHCKRLRKLPDDIGSLKKLVKLSLGFSEHQYLGRISEFINLHTLRNLCHLRVLDLRGRQIEDRDLFDILDTLSSLEELSLASNLKLVELPASISRLSCLKLLDLSKCKQLRNIQGLPSGIHVLKEHNCEALEKIEDLTEECVWLYKIRLVGCNKLLRNQENERYLEKMLQQSFLKKCATLDRRLSILIPGSKIPSWFEEQQQGSKITLKLSPKCCNGVMGFAVCVVFNQKWSEKSYGSSLNMMIIFRMEKNGKLIPKLKVDCTDESAATMNGSVWIVYIPVSSFEEEMHDDYEGANWSHLVEGSLCIDVSALEIERCGAYIIYKEDIESVQQINTSISYHQDEKFFCHNGNDFCYYDSLK